MAKEWTKEEILIRIESNNIWVEHGIIAIYNKQTTDEQSIETTKYANIGV